MRGIFEFDRDAPTKDCPQFFEKNCDDDRHCAPPTLDSALNFLLSCHHRTYSGDPFICVTNAKISEVSLVQPMVQIESKTLRWFIYITCCTMDHRNKSGDPFIRMTNVDTHLLLVACPIAHRHSRACGSPTPPQTRY